MLPRMIQQENPAASPSFFGIKNCSMIPPSWRYINALKMPDLNTSRVDVTSMPPVEGRHVKGLGQL